MTSDTDLEVPRPVDPGRRRHAAAPEPVTHHRAVVGAGLLVIAVACAVRAWTLSRTWFYLDDFAIINGTYHHGLGPGELTTAYFGHLMPAGRALGWLIAATGPNNYGTAAVEIMVLLVLTAVGLLRLLVTLFGARPAILVPLTYFLFSPWLIPLTTWWAAGINHLPALAATVWALDAHVRYLREHRRRDLVVSVAWMVFGLLFAELALLGYLPILLISLMYFARGTLLQRVHQTWRGSRPAVLAHGALVAAYVAFYLVTSWHPIASSNGSVPWRDYLVNVLGNVLPSSFIGGPISWQQLWSAQFDVAPPGGVRLLGLAVLAGVFALSAMARERALRAWLLPLAQLLASVVLMSQTRVVFGPSLILDLRFTAPVALEMALAIGLAFLPVVGAVESAGPRAPHWLVDHRAPVVAALCAFAVLGTWSAAAYPLRHVPAPQSPGDYYARFEQSLATHPTPVDLVDRNVADYVIGPPLGSYSTALSQYGDRVRFPTVVQDDFYVLDHDGRLVHPGLDIARRAKPVDGTAGCDGYQVSDGGRSIPLDGPVFGAVWRLRFGHTAPAATSGTITVGGSSTDVPFLEGTHTLEMSGVGRKAYSGFQVSGLDDGATVCLTGAAVGQDEAAGDPTS